MSNQRPWNTSLTSLVVTLSPDPAEADRVQSEIANHEAISAAPLEGHYLPIVIEDVDARSIHRWLESLPGVLNVDVVFCSTEELAFAG